MMDLGQMLQEVKNIGRIQLSVPSTYSTILSHEDLHNNLTSLFSGDPLSRKFGKPRFLGHDFLLS